MGSQLWTTSQGVRGILHPNHEPGGLPLTPYILFQDCPQSWFETACFGTGTRWSFRGATPQGKGALTPYWHDSGANAYLPQISILQAAWPHFTESYQSSAAWATHSWWVVAAPAVLCHEDLIGPLLLSLWQFYYFLLSGERACDNFQYPLGVVFTSFILHPGINLYSFRENRKGSIF